ncbi:MAG: hypothetical protein R3B99_24390 [Polyangiales bacterium]
MNDDEALARRVEAACARHGLAGDDVFLVWSLLERPETSWPACCETDCSPCMKVVHAAAREARDGT